MNDAFSSLKKFLPAPGEPEVEFDVWLKMFEAHFQAAYYEKTIEPDHKRMMLEAALGREGQRIFYAIKPAPVKTATVDAFTAAVNALTSRFTPQINVIAERDRFNKCNQLPGQSVEDFITTLRQLAVRCEFQDEDERIRDRMVTGNSCERTREKLLSEPKLNLKRAIEIAKLVETAKKEKKSIGSVASEQSVDWMSKRDKKPSNKASGSSTASGSAKKFGSTCGNCGLNHNRNGHCPAYGKECLSCGKRNHFAKCCRSTKTKKLGSVSTIQGFRQKKRDNWD